MRPLAISGCKVKMFFFPPINTKYIYVQGKLCSPSSFSPISAIALNAFGELQSKTVNWCRGIELFEDYYITTTEGRYDQYAPFFNVTFVGKNDCSIEHIKVPYELLEFPDQIKYMTGFAVQII